MLHLWRELNNLISQIQEIVTSARDINPIKEIVAQAPLTVDISDYTAFINLEYDTNVFKIYNGYLTFREFTDSSYTIPISVKYLEGKDLSWFYLKNTDITFDKKLIVNGSLLLPDKTDLVEDREIAIHDGTLYVRNDGTIHKFTPDGGQIAISGFDFVISYPTHLEELSGKHGEARIIQDLVLDTSSDLTIDTTEKLKLSGMAEIQGSSDGTSTSRLTFKNGVFLIDNIGFVGRLDIVVDNAILIIENSYDNSNLHFIGNNGAVLRLKNYSSYNIRIETFSQVEIINADITLSTFGNGYPLLTQCDRIKLDNVKIVREAQWNIPLIGDVFTSTKHWQLEDVYYILSTTSSGDVTIDNTSPYNFKLIDITTANADTTVNLILDGIYVEFDADITVHIADKYAPINIVMPAGTVNWNILVENYFIFINKIYDTSNYLGMFKFIGQSIYILRGGDETNNNPLADDSGFITDSSTSGIYLKHTFGGAPINMFDILNYPSTVNNREVWLGNVYIKYSS